jgi:hypothetical protein
MALGTLFTSIGSLLLNGVGLYMEEEQNKEVRAESKAALARDTAKEEARYRTSLAMTRDQIAYERAQAERGWKWKEEDRNWQRAREFGDRVTSMVSRTPGLQDRLVNIWAQRSAL